MAKYIMYGPRVVSNKIELIKSIRALLNLGLKDSKDIADSYSVQVQDWGGNKLEIEDNSILSKILDNVEKLSDHGAASMIAEGYELKFIVSDWKPTMKEDEIIRETVLTQIRQSVNQLVNACMYRDAKILLDALSEMDD